MFFEPPYCRLVNANGYKLKDYVVEKNCDIIAVTETWLPTDDAKSEVAVKALCPKGYVMPHKPRTTGHRGGGVGLMHKR